MPAERPLSTLTIHCIITERLFLAGVKKPWIVVHSLRHSTSTFALLNDANPTQVQKMMRYQHHSDDGDLCRRIEKLLEGAEEAVTQFMISRPSPFKASSIGPYGLPPLSRLRPSSGIALAQR